MDILGIDIGGSGIKGAPVHIMKGELVTDRHRIPTPQPSKPKAVAEVVAQIVNYFNWSGPIGITFPAIVKNGVTLSAANVHNKWIGTNAKQIFENATHNPILVLNDADAAGIAEMQFGAGRAYRENHIVMILTLGTGIGSAIFINGKLFPNTELGHLKIHNKDAEHRASERARGDENLSWKEWGQRVNEYLQRLEFLFSPDVFIIGGGVSKKHEKFFKYLDTEATLLPAELRNEAGIIGAAYAARNLK